MAYSKLCLLLLLSSCSLAQPGAEHNEQTSPCLLASRFKAHKKYVYQYTTESRNGVVGTSDLKTGPKLSCQVEIEVPQTCRFVMQTRECALSEAAAVDAQGRLVYRQAAAAQAFRRAMEKNPLRFSVEDLTRVQLYPEGEEPVNILNIKRGIVSALLVPAMEDEQSSLMSTVHGQCLTDYVINSRREVAADVTLLRDLSRCDQFYSRELAGSPLALLQKLHRPMSKLITSTQDCNYKVDSKGKHVTSATCTEKHTYLPFSRGENGISSVVIQELSLQSAKRIGNRGFDVNPRQRRPLHFEDPDDKAAVQTKDAALSTLRELLALAGTDQGQSRTSLFHRLVSGLRTLRNETLSRTVSEMLDTSAWLTWQALLQCGTSECTSAILQAIRTIDGVGLEVDALVYGLSLKANPDAARVRDMLSMAQYKQSKAIMYALANTVKNFYQGEVTPEVADVASFMETLLNDCSADTDLDYDSEFPPDPVEMSFLVLRVVGVMGKAMQAASPRLMSSILKCARRSDIPLSNQKSAIQAFRQMEVNDEVREALMAIYQDARSPAEKRIAAYLILMKNPDQALLRTMVNELENIREEQLKNFVVSHLKNIHISNELQMHQFREHISLALQDRPLSTRKVFDGMSRNYKVNSPLGSVQSNVIFDATDTLPKEVMLETTLKVFDYNCDVFEVGFEATGFEPTIEALFGKQGFFPDSISKVLYWADDKAQMLRRVLDRISPDRAKREVPLDLVKDLTKGVQKLMDDLRSSPSSEATAYLRLLGNEIGYMKTSEIRKMADTLFMYFHFFIRVLPAKTFSMLTSSTDNEAFAHYIFLENAFSLPTASGFPLKFSLAGVFAPGAKGGVAFSSTTGGLSLMPSLGLEFVTQMGVHIPDYVEAGVEMHTNMYHESSLNAKIAVSRNQIQLSIPAPKSNTQLFTFSNTLLLVSSGQKMSVPSLVEQRTDSPDCQPLFRGLNLCSIARYSAGAATEEAPSFPLTGDTKFAVEIQPTGEVSEFTGTITYETLREGRDGRHKVDSLRLALQAKGEDSTEATASLKYNRNKGTLTTEVVIPDYDVEAGIRLEVMDRDVKQNKMLGITIDVTNKNIPQLTLVGRTRLEMMKDAMLQLQMVIPSMKSNASVTATMKKDDDVLMNVETRINLLETSYHQKASLKYDDDKFEVELNSDLNSDIQKLMPNDDDQHGQLQRFIDNILDQKVSKTDMKLRHIVTKGIEAGDIWLDKLTVSIPSLASLRNKRILSGLTFPSLPEKLFLRVDNFFRYEFNKGKFAISIPLPLGGKKSKELNIPAALSVPLIDVPAIGLYIPAQKYPIPSFTLPLSLDFNVPVLGLAEASAKINSNFYSWEGSVAGGNNTVDVPNYVAQYKAMATSPLSLLAYKLEGTGMISGRAEDHLKYLLNTSFSHGLVKTSFSVTEDVLVTDKVMARANYKIQASSPLGFHASVDSTAQSTSTSDEVTGDGTLDGTFEIGSLNTSTSYVHSYHVHPLKREGRGESTLRFDSPFLQVHNVIHGSYANSELSVLAKTNTQRDVLRHLAELRYKDSQLTLKCNAAAKTSSKSLSNKVELGVSGHMALLRIESQADDEQNNRAYSLITSSLDPKGLVVNSEGSLSFKTVLGLHKASVVIDGSGLTANGTNSIQRSPVAFENIFSGAVGSKGASLSSRTKATAEAGRGELNVEGKITAVEASLGGVLEGAAYSASTRNDLNVVLNRRGLTCTANSTGTMMHMRTENNHTLTLTLWTLTLRSRTDNVISRDIRYKQDARVDVRPFVVKLNVTNELKLYDATLASEGHVRLQPGKASLSGGTRAAYGENHHVEHTYEISYDNMAGAMTSSTSGNLMDHRLSHKCELEFAGLSSKSVCESQIDSELLHLDSTVRTAALPFSLTIDALVKSDGELNLYGRHTEQLYSKLLVKAEPLAIAYAHDSRISTTHALPRREVSTLFDNKLDGLLTPSDQALTWRVKSKLNDHVYNQNISAYNNPQRTGFEFSGVVFTDVFNGHNRGRRSTPEMQEFAMSGILGYDKSSDCHIMAIPFIESFPAAFEKLRNTFVQTLETLQQFISNLNVNQAITDFRAKLDELPAQVRDFMQAMHLEDKVNQLKAKLDYLKEDFAVTMDDFELVMDTLRQNLENGVMDVATKIKDLMVTVRDYVRAGHLADKVTNVMTQVGNHLHAFNEKYKIQESLLTALGAIEDVIRRTDLQKLTGSSAAWLRQLDSRYRIMDNIRDKMSEMKQAVVDFDVKTLLEDAKDALLSVDVAAYLEQLSYKVPSAKIAKIIESMTDVVVNWIDEYEIPNKLNAVYSYIRDLFTKYELDVEFKELLDQAVVLIQEFKIQETLQSVADALKAIKYEFVHDKMMQFLHRVTSQLRAIDLKKSIRQLNEHVSSTLTLMKEFDYNAFVDEANRKMVEMTDFINKQIETYEIVQKIEAVREFFREIQNVIFTNLDTLKNTKVADALKNLKDVIDTTIYNDVKMKVQDVLEDIRQRIVDMDLRAEIYIYLQRASESYRNLFAFISAKLNQLMEKISNVVRDNDTFSQIKQVVDGFMAALKQAEIQVPTFAVPLTDLVIPAFTIRLNRLEEISIPAEISLPEFTILNSIRIPGFTLVFDEIKAKMVAIIDNIRSFEIQTIDPEEIFGNLKVLYLTDFPDFTFPEVRLSEITFPAIGIPKLNLKDFEITVLPIPAIKLPEIPCDICMPVFGKLHGEVRVTSPLFTLVTTGKIENSTSSPKNPQFTATITSLAKSPIENLGYNFEATAQLEAPRLKRLLIKETMKASHVAFSIDHEASVTFTGSSAEASAKTAAKATTQTYAADFNNSMALTLKNGISAAMNTAYNHNLDLPSMETSSQASVIQDVAATLGASGITLTSETTGNGKWSIQDYSDEGTHKSSLEFSINLSTTKLAFVGETLCKSFKSEQRLTAEAVTLSHIVVEARCESEGSLVKKSSMAFSGEAHLGDLKVALSAHHDAELSGSTTGSMSNSLEFLAHPFEIVLDVKNKANLKIFFPLKLTGKVDLQHDYGIILKSNKQKACWFALARFNQYRYNHNITAENTELDTLFHSSATGEANLDFLTVPLSIPEMTLPYLNITTPQVRDLSLWEHAGFKILLATPQQSFDTNLKIHYHKSPDVHSFEFPLEPVYNGISDNAHILQAKFEQLRDKLVALLRESYKQANSHYIKHNVDTSSLPPRIFTIPGFKIPILNIEMSSFSVEMPAFSYFVPKEVSTPSFRVPALAFSMPSYTLVLPSLEFPVLHVPETLTEVKLPTFTLPAIKNNIVIPALGNLTCDFSFKSTVITLSANAGLYNQSDIVARFGASSTSMFDIFNGKMDGTTSVTRKRGIKLASTVGLEHRNVKASHECALSLTKRSMEGSVGSNVKISLPFLDLELDQELTGNTNTKPNIASKKKIKYMFNIPLIKSVGKGNMGMSWALEALSSYVSLDSSIQGKSNITVMDSYDIAGDLKNEASFYLNANGLRSTVTTDFSSNVDRQETQTLHSNSRVLQFDLNENFAFEMSLRRVFAAVDYTSNNNFDFAYFNTNGKHTGKGELEFVPLTTLMTKIDIDASQPSSLGHAGLLQSINLAISSEKQSFTWSSKEQLASLVHACDLLVSNNESEARVDLTGSIEGHLAFLKSVKFPVYQRTLWDVLKFDEATNIRNAQFLNISSSIVYTKSMEGREYAIPLNLFEDGVIFSIPEISIAVPSWVKDIPRSMRSTGMESNFLSLPPMISVPDFDVPFTNLHVEPFTLDPKSVIIPKEITTKAFDIIVNGLPIMSVPSFHINTEYLQGKTSFLSFQIPQFEIAVPSFTLPKSFDFGEHTLDLNEIASHISNSELPNIVIPEQKIEIPGIALHLPSSVFIPAFGGLSATLKVSSPIYNVSTTASLKKKDSSLVTALNSISTSTVIFLEHDLSCNATLGFDYEAMGLNGACHLVHSDVNVDWQHILGQNPRDSRHTLSVDVTSPTFADVHFRYASRKDSITASASSPSSGFLGMHFQRRTPTQLYGKVFSRYLSAPGKDIDVFTAKATLRHSQKLNLHTSWNMEVLHDVIEGTKDRVPAMTDAVLRFMNKYHTAHFGFDLSRGGMKIKNTLSNVIERAYHEAPVPFDSLQNSIEHLSDQGKDMYMRASDRLRSINAQDVVDRLAFEAKQVLNHGESSVRALLGAATASLRNTEITVPGSGEKLSALQLLQRAHLSAWRASDRAIKRFSSLMEKIYTYIRGIEFTVPGTEVVVNGNNIMEKCKSASGHLRSSVRRWLDLLLSRVREHFQAIAEKHESFISYLRDENVKVASRVDALYADVLQSSKQNIGEARQRLAAFKDLTKLRLQEAYDSMRTERVNNDTREALSILQSHLYGGLNEFVDLMRTASQKTEPYLKMSNKKMDVEIPLPFVWRSFGEWPTQLRD